MILNQTGSSFSDFLSQSIDTFWGFTGFANCEWGNIVMLACYQERFRTIIARANRFRYAYR